MNRLRCEKKRIGCAALLLAVLLAALLLILSSAGCSVNAPKSGVVSFSPQPWLKGKKTIGFSVENASLPYYKVLLDYAYWEAARQSVNLVVTDAGSDAQAQSRQIEQMLEMGIDALCVAPADYESIEPALKAAKDKGIPIVGFSSAKSNTNEIYYDSFVGASMIEEAEMAAKSAIAILDDTGGNVLILEGPQGKILSRQRTDGFVMGLREAPNIHVVWQLNCALDKEAAHALMKDVLAQGAQIDLLYAQDDILALGAIDAMKAAGMGGEFPIVSIGGSGDGLEAIKRGEMYSTVFQPPDWEGVTTVSTAIKLINGEKTEKWIKTPVSLVNKVNVTEYKGLW